MQLPSQSTAALAAVLLALFARCAAAQEAPTRDPAAIAPRATPGDYQAQAQAGPITIAAEFTGHSIATPQTILSTEEYVVVEVGVFGPPGARVKLSHEDFSIRINGKKMPSPAQPYALVSKNAKDPEWEALAPPEAKKSKGGVSTGGGGGQNDAGPPPVVKIPVELRRAMEQKVLKASLPEGDRVLPEAGLIYFEHGGKVTNIRSIELLYDGAAGKATLTLHP
jgi:hypothetical protein